MAQITSIADWQNVISSASAEGFEYQLAAGGEEITQASIDAILKKAAREHGLEVVRDANGTYSSMYRYIQGSKDLDALKDIGTVVNSNEAATVAENITKFRQPMQVAVETAADGSKIAKFTPVKEIATTAGGKVLGALGTAGAIFSAVSVGASLGQAINKIAYKVNPDLFKGIGDPDKIDYKDYFGNIVGGLFNFFLGTNPDTGNAQLYMNANDYAMLALQLQNLGYFTPRQVIEYPTEHGLEKAHKIVVTNKPETHTNIEFAKILTNIIGVPVEYRGSYPNGLVSGTDTTLYGISVAYNLHKTPGAWAGVVTVNNNRTLYINGPADDTAYKVTYRSDGSSANFARRVLFWDDNEYKMYFLDAHQIWSLYYGITNNASEHIGDLSHPTYIRSTINATEKTFTSSIEGVDGQDGAVLPDLSNINQTGATPIADTLAYLRQTYPALFENAITMPVAPPEFYPNRTPDEIPQIQLVPVPIPDGVTYPDNDPNKNPYPTPDNEPVTGPATQNDPELKPDNKPGIDTATDILNPGAIPTADPDPTPPNPDTGIGITPPIVLPDGDAEALFTVYNPTQAEVNAFGKWLWSADPIQQLLKMFNNPIEAVITLHKVYITPDIGDRKEIVCGYLGSGVQANTVKKQYSSILLGSVSLPEYFGNVFDYSPYTDVSIYLPFVGIRQLAVSDIMRSTIQVRYDVDVYTGSLLASVNVVRDGGQGGTLYTFSGNCAVEYPLSAGSYAPLYNNLATLGLTAGASALTGNPMYLAGGAARSFLSEQRSVYRTGNFSGNAGAMGIKQPYLIIGRPQPNLASKFPSYQGKPTNYTTTVGACSGFIKAKVDHIENVNATDSELTEIDNLLQQGILV